MNQVKNKFGIVMFLFLVLTSGLKAQDFIPTVGVTASNGSRISGLEMLEREKLMPHHISAIKKNGVSVEIHTSSDGGVTYFYYSSEGLLVRSPGADFYYDDQNRLVGVEQILYVSKIQITEFIRDPSGRIKSIKRGDGAVTYRYSNGILQQIGAVDPLGSYIQKAKDSPSYNYSDDEFYGSFDRFGRCLTFEMGKCNQTFNFDENNRWTGYKFNCADTMGGWYPMSSTITYENGLMKSINDDGEITTIKYEYGHKAKK